jgi:hypothetical protein
MSIIKLIKLIIITVVSLVAIVVIYTFVIHPITWKIHADKNAIQVLQQVQTTNELAQVVGDLGVFLTFQDGSWMAIKYSDSHAGRVVSSAIIRDSEDQWYSSDYHFCGYFTVYKERVEAAKRIENLTDEDLSKGANSLAMAGFEDIHQLIISPDLKTARKNLEPFNVEKLEINNGN